MNYRALSHEDIEVFSEAISAFFLNMTLEAATVRTAYLLGESSAEPWGDFNGVIHVSGGFRGNIIFSAPLDMLSQVLDEMGERDQSAIKCLDVVGEIANMMSGQARRHFGESLEISPPATSLRSVTRLPSLASGIPYAIPLRWRSFEANLVVHLDVRR